MDDLSVWGIENWDDSPDAVDDDHRILDKPSEEILLHRTVHGPDFAYVEYLWIRGYVNATCIVATCPPMRSGEREIPGVIRWIPVGWRDMASAATFRAKLFSVVGSYERNGWARPSAAHAPDMNRRDGE